LKFAIGNLHLSKTSENGSGSNFLEENQNIRTSDHFTISLREKLLLKWLTGSLIMSLVPMVSLFTLHAKTVVLSLEQFKLDSHVPIQ
jgi:positive regulator of sigma E activity